MKKEQILVHDNRGEFLKMFKRKFKNEFDFSENLFFSSDDTGMKKFDRVIYVIYDKLELLGFLKKKKKGNNILVCLFDRQFYKSLSFLEEINNLILFDDSKTRNELLKELQAHFEIKVNSLKAKKQLNKTNMQWNKFYDYYKALYFLV